jgi:hypothetical protein
MNFLLMLEYAAKAVGIPWENGGPSRMGWADWNPLIRITDRYELARTLGLCIDFENKTVCKTLPGGETIIASWGIADSPRPGTFRPEEWAIVYVASEIGKRMP